MILGAEIGIFVYGLYVLISGKYALGQKRFVVGSKARILGIICILPLPVAFFIGLLIGFISSIATGETLGIGITAVIEIVILIAAIVLISMLGKRFYQQQQAEMAQDTTL